MVEAVCENDYMIEDSPFQFKNFSILSVETGSNRVLNGVFPQMRGCNG